MSRIEKFEDLKIWKSSRRLAENIFRVIVSDPKIKDHPLKDQINRSSGSIMDNIAEGFDRQGNKEFRQFLTIAKASCSEVKSQLYRLYDRNAINEIQFDELYQETDTISKMIHGLIHYLNTQNTKAQNLRNRNLNIII